jgi:hypothetical protein
LPLESGVVETSDPIDHDDDLFALETLDAHQRTNGVACQTWSHEREDDRGDVLETAALWVSGVGDRSPLIVHRPLTAIGYQRFRLQGYGEVVESACCVRMTKGAKVSRSAAWNSLRHVPDPGDSR